ncbi:MAG TPA: hypothetical protein VNZ52_15790 [Candidatus Thermoplasmatota archaeon]|nr:hypothetical protein [Candidatus Thermoplasmatota archaeon]
MPGPSPENAPKPGPDKIQAARKGLGGRTPAEGFSEPDTSPREGADAPRKRPGEQHS